MGRSGFANDELYPLQNTLCVTLVLVLALTPSLLYLRCGKGLVLGEEGPLGRQLRHEPGDPGILVPLRVGPDPQVPATWTERSWSWGWGLGWDLGPEKVRVR